QQKIRRIIYGRPEIKSVHRPVERKQTCNCQDCGKPVTGNSTRCFACWRKIQAGLGK
ncbi:MAG: hypothetical protein HZC29_00845, partial [Thaumarchaeota archaeon]|nr:hypothetical protein [Nitrososphaerota archaeon]